MVFQGADIFFDLLKWLIPSGL
jgi:hypothetical protein